MGPLGVALTVVVGAVLSLTVYSATGSLLHDPAVDWAGYDLVVIRSTWDYVARHREFLAWAADVPPCSP